MTSNQALTLSGNGSAKTRPSACSSRRHRQPCLSRTGGSLRSWTVGLILAFADDILRIFLQEAKFWVLEEKDIPEDFSSVRPVSSATRKKRRTREAS
jgi:hypothetical protein